MHPDQAVAMNSERRGEVTEVLRQISAGELPDDERLFALVYEELRAVARGALRSENPGQSLDSAGLVHEAYLRLIGEEPRWEGRRHFMACAARAMRRILVEHARKRQRRSDRLARIPLGDDVGGDVAGLDTEPDAILFLDVALDRLGERSRRKHEVVMMRYFGGLSIEETAEALQVSPATVKNDWAFARTWLHREIERVMAE